MTTSTSGLSQSNFIWRNALVSDLLHHIDFVKDAYLVVGASDVVRSRLGLSLEQPRDGGWVDLEEAGSSGGGLLAFRNHLSNLGLLLRGELGAATADAALLTGGIDSGLSAFPQHGALELREGPHHLHHHPAGRSRRVDRLGQTPESGANFPELLHDR